MIIHQNKTKIIMTIEVGHVTLVGSLNSHDIILVVFKWIIKQDCKKKCLVTGDWSQSSRKLEFMMSVLMKGN